MGFTILRTDHGRLDAADAPALAALQARLAAAPSKVLLHLHGGLVAQTQGEAIARRLSGQGELAYNAPEPWEQVYVVWRTGAFETLRTRWLDLARDDRLYRALLRRLLGLLASKLLAGAAGGRSTGTAAVDLSPAEVERRLNSGAPDPFGDVDAGLTADDAARSAAPLIGDRDFAAEIIAELEGDPGVVGAAEALAAAVEAEAAPTGVRTVTSDGDAPAGAAILARLDSSARAELAQAADTPQARSLGASAAVLKAVVTHGAAIAIRVKRRFAGRRDHGLQATVVEELVREFWGEHIGTAVWGAMKAQAADHFTDGGLGGALLDVVTSRDDHQVVVAGHSAGAIWATGLLRAAAKRPTPPRFDLALLAPAVRVRLFANMLDECDALIGRFQLFAMQDSLERIDAVLGPGTASIYPASLLYLVSGLFEADDAAAAVDAPILGMQRFMTGAAAPDWLVEPAERAAAARVRAFLAQRPGAACYAKENSGAGRWSEATSHGGFDSERRTLESVATLFV